MKRLLSVILAVYFIISLFCGMVSADTQNYLNVTSRMPCGGFLASVAIPAKEIEEINLSPKKGLRSQSVPIEEYLETGLRNKAVTLEIYPSYEIQAFETDKGLVCPEFNKILRTVLFNNYRLMVLNDISGCRCGRDKETGKIFVLSFEPKYLTFEEGETEALKTINDGVQAYVDAVRDIPNEDVVGKMLVIYDLFCKNNVYATEEYNEEKYNKIPHNETRTAYYVFKNNRAVCQGNAIALKAIYDALNTQLTGGTGETVIETTLCSSDNLEHIWNVVKVDGKWYYIDETWDDNEYEIPDEEEVLTGCYHNYFMVPLSAMGGHLNDDPQNWIYYCDDVINCYDDKYISGHIFNGDCYTYFKKDEEVWRANCGSYFGTTSYEDGRYKIEIVGRRKYDADSEEVYFCPSVQEEQPVTEPFWSQTITSSGLIATDVYDTVYDNKQCKAVYLFANGSIESGISGYYARYGENGVEHLKNNKISDSSESGSEIFLPYYIGNNKGRLFFWSKSGLEPLCRSIDIP